MQKTKHFLPKGWETQRMLRTGAGGEGGQGSLSSSAHLKRDTISMKNNKRELEKILFTFSASARPASGHEVSS